MQASRCWRLKFSEFDTNSDERLYLSPSVVSNVVTKHTQWDRLRGHFTSARYPQSYQSVIAFRMPCGYSSLSVSCSWSVAFLDCVARRQLVSLFCEVVLCRSDAGDCCVIG